jgi:hypothetical protein
MLVPVKAGNETGVYYLIMSNLPWHTSWQKLKDLARNQQPNGGGTDIDHAYINPDSPTNGWVRVRGRENFFAARGTFPSIENLLVLPLILGQKT